MESKNNIKYNGLPFDEKPKQRYLKDIIEEDGNYFIFPKCIALLPLDEGMLFGYYIDVEGITTHIKIEGEDYFQCSTEKFVLKMFRNENRQYIRRLQDKLVAKGLIKRYTMNINGKNTTYIHINYDAYDKLKQDQATY